MLPLSPHYLYSSSLGNKANEQEMRIASIPSIFYGSSIKKGKHVGKSLYFRNFGRADLLTILQNGELRQVLPNDGPIVVRLLAWLYIMKDF